MNDSAETQAEQVLCTTLLWNPELADDLPVSHDEFLDSQYGLIFRTVQHFRGRGKPVTWTTVSNALRDRIDDEHRNSLVDANLAQTWAVVEHARIIRRSATRRRAVQAAQKVIEIAQTSPDMGDEAMAEIEAAVSQIAASSEEDKGPVAIADAMTDYLDRIEGRYRNKGVMNGVPTGFKALDYITGGWKKGELAILAARPSMGKTAFMLQTASNVAQNDMAVIFSVEMMTDVLLDRLTASHSHVPLYNLSNGRIADDEWKKITDAIATLGTRNLYVDDNPYSTVPYIRAKLRRIARQVPEGKRLVAFVDYLQIVKSSRRGRSRNEEVGEISTELKAIANELGCCVVALAQLSRSVEQRQDKHPTLSDIRDSGQIEQDADIVMFLYRDEYYNPESTKKNVVEVIVGKHRNGPTGVAEIVFLKEYQAFYNLDREG